MEKVIVQRMKTLLSINNSIKIYLKNHSNSKYAFMFPFVLQNILGTNDIIYKNWKTVIWGLPTLSSLAMNIFRINYLKDGLIPQISGSIYDFIKEGFMGGACDMYLPSHFYNWEGKYLYGYDVNSLFPYIMKISKLPCGDIHYFEGDLLKERPGKLGFCYCHVEAPKDLKHPFLLVHYKNRTVAGLGKFVGVYYTREIEHALKLGYKIKIINGFYFSKSEILFDKYVDSLYELRTQYSKGDPMNIISKLLLNSLYGRMSLDDRHNDIKVYDFKEFKALLENDEYSSKIEHWDEFKEARKMLVETIFDRYTNDFNSNYEDNHMSSIGISAAVTAEARIFMDQFKNNPELELYYTDTDSIFTTSSPEDMEKLFPGIISSKGLGKLKHEYTIINAIFLSPKCYWLELEDGNKVIRIKGVKREFIEEALNNYSLTFENFSNLLVKDEIINLNQEKWYRDYVNAGIEISKQAHQVKQTDNKRSLVYEDDICIDTKPIVFDLDDFKEQSSKKFF